jgi:hypothetical protein
VIVNHRVSPNREFHRSLFNLFKEKIMIKLRKKDLIDLAHRKALCAFLYSLDDEYKDVYEMFNKEMRMRDPILCVRDLRYI